MLGLCCYIFPPGMFTAFLSDCSGFEAFLCLRRRFSHSCERRRSRCGLTVVLCKSTSRMGYWWLMLLFWETLRSVWASDGKRGCVCDSGRILQCADERSWWTVLESISTTAAPSLIVRKRAAEYLSNVHLYCIQIVYTNTQVISPTHHFQQVKANCFRVKQIEQKCCTKRKQADNKNKMWVKNMVIIYSL